MITRAKQDYCGHGFSMGFCPHECVKVYYHTEAAQVKRAEFLKLFKKRDWKNPITRMSIIQKLHQFYNEERWVQYPINVIKFGNVKLEKRPNSITKIA